MQKLKQIFGILIMIFIVSCQYDPYAHKYTTTEPSETEIIGNYVFEKQTVDYNIIEFKDSIKNQIIVPKIEIKSDGTYKVVNFPVFETWNPTFTGLITNSGKWNKTTVGSIGDGTGELKKHWGINFDQLPEESQNVGLMNKKYPYKLIFGFGDPDEGNAMIFKKE
jgi:hypothetical protein